MTSSTFPIQLRRLLWVGPLAVVASVIGVLLIQIIAVAILKPDPLPMSLNWGPPIVFTVVLVSAAVIVFALVTRFIKNPMRTYQIIALVVLVVSFLPDVGYAGSSMPGASWPVAIALMIMHVVAWAICVSILTRLSVASNQ
jgi:hypothetical protein